MLHAVFFKEGLPARAQKLFNSTFRQYNDPAGANEEVAFKMARAAVEREYVKLNNNWIPKKAAETIVSHDIYDSDTDEEHYTNSLQPTNTSMANHPNTTLHNNKNDKNYGNAQDVDEYEEENDGDEDEGFDYNDKFNYSNKYNNDDDETLSDDSFR
ncbi:hypothetical protein AhnVgp039 [Adoxophyes honmai nucleopolyhedrovirus]|uniref:Uncharacterized protein n=1 Tax=Adoxophyes honmai nucleopolyhedrovirus TaxID=224399 RepID=Q80LQ7_NPVAH|nr:hypothetical protein AhnVgp039 [Adoxophyes honmai nucleopolyhedrovirus]BAC67290.1 hypothetical protein [Adoxophyes honmai nucleopolyhedrovirus]